MKEVLAKSVGDSASFLQFSGDSEVSFFRGSVLLLHGGVPTVMIIRSFEHCLASGSGRWSQGVSSLWCGGSVPTYLDGISTQVFGKLV